MNYPNVGKLNLECTLLNYKHKSCGLREGSRRHPFFIFLSLRKLELTKNKKRYSREPDPKLFAEGHAHIIGIK